MKHLIKISLFLLPIAIFFFSKNAEAAERRNPPILILGSPGHFDLYTGEILKTEGFNEFETDSITDGDLSLKHLRTFDIIILTETCL